MSDEPTSRTEATENDRPAGDEATTGERASEEPTTGEKPAERFDEDGLPLDRDATIDDVRSKTGLHGRIGVGCALLIVLFVVAFWLIRAGALG